MARLRAAHGGIDAASGVDLAYTVSAPSAFSTDQFPGRPSVEAAGRLHTGHLTVAPARPVVARSTTGTTRWLRRYQGSLVLIDAAAAALAGVLAYFARFGVADTSSGRFIDAAFAATMPLVWIGVVALNRAYEGRFVGVGTAEFERVFRAFLHLTALTAFVSFASKVQVARGFLLVALPLALAFDLIGRYGARKQLHGRRARGESLTSVLAVGGVAAVASFTSLLRHDQYAGMRVVGACLPVLDAEGADAADELGALGVPVLGDVDTVVESARACGAHSVAVLSGEITAEKLRWISWQLEGTETDLIVSPGLAEVGGRRLHIQPVAGLPLLHVDEPEFTGFRRMLKGAFDRSVAAAALVILAPLMLVIALVVRLTSHGPALFRQMRVGVGGSSFTLYKFRSMCVDAEERLGALQQHNERSDGLLFKIKNDPRVTRFGSIIRRYSLDELPQLINVVKGDMSLVGPRPPLSGEVAQYADDVRRRLLVKPGITGLWQISGRSDLSWEESVRLDLHYVENWSLATDLVILWKTCFTVVRGAGAY